MIGIWAWSVAFIIIPSLNGTHFGGELAHFGDFFGLDAGNIGGPFVLIFNLRGVRRLSVSWCYSLNLDLYIASHP